MSEHARSPSRHSSAGMNGAESCCTSISDPRRPTETLTTSACTRPTAPCVHGSTRTGCLSSTRAELPTRGLTPERLVGQASTAPFLANARLVAVAGLIVSLGSAKGVAVTWQPLLDTLPLLPESNHIVLLEPAPTRDARTTLGRSPLLRALRAIEGADVQQFAALSLYGRGADGNEVVTWLLERAQQQGAELERAAAKRLSELLGADLWALSTELDKLARYAGDRPVAVADVELLTTAARDEDVFALVDDAIDGRTPSALLRLRRLLEGGAEHPGHLQALIARQLRNLIRAGELIEQGASREEIGRATGVSHPYPLGRLVTQAEAIGRPAAETRATRSGSCGPRGEDRTLPRRTRTRATAHQPAAPPCRRPAEAIATAEAQSRRAPDCPVSECTTVGRDGKIPPMGKLAHPDGNGAEMAST